MRIAILDISVLTCVQEMPVGKLEYILMSKDLYICKLLCGFISFNLKVETKKVYICPGFRLNKPESFEPLKASQTFQYFEK